MRHMDGASTSDAILRETLRALREISDKQVRVERVVVGLFFTGVKLSDGHGGVCYTPIKSIPEAACCPSSAKALPTPGKLRGREALRVAEDALSGGPIERALGIAVMNALSDAYWSRERPRGYTIRAGVDPIDQLAIPEEAFVVVVGALVPYLRVLKARGKPFCVLEKDAATLKPDEMPFYAPAELSVEKIPRADVLIATGTTLINGTLEGLLALARPSTHITVVGPTASMVPDAFFGRGVRFMGGIRVTEPDALLNILAEGGSGYHFFGTLAEKVLLLSDA